MEDFREATTYKRRVYGVCLTSLWQAYAWSPAFRIIIGKLLTLPRNYIASGGCFLGKSRN